jgi:hypothetical protein
VGGSTVGVPDSAAWTKSGYDAMKSPSTSASSSTAVVLHPRLKMPPQNTTRLPDYANQRQSVSRPAGQGGSILVNQEGGVSIRANVSEHAPPPQRHQSTSASAAIPNPAVPGAKPQISYPRLCGMLEDWEKQQITCGTAKDTSRLSVFAIHIAEFLWRIPRLGC